MYINQIYRVLRPWRKPRRTTGQSLGGFHPDNPPLSGYWYAFPTVKGSLLQSSLGRKGISSRHLETFTQQWAHQSCSGVTCGEAPSNWWISLAYVVPGAGKPQDTVSQAKGGGHGLRHAHAGWLHWWYWYLLFPTFHIRRYIPHANVEISIREWPCLWRSLLCMLSSDFPGITGPMRQMYDAATGTSCDRHHVRHMR